MMLRAEVRKITTTRTTTSLLAGAIAVVALAALSTTASADSVSLDQPIHTQQLYLLGSINIGLFALILGIQSFTGEFHHRTIAWTMLSTRERWRIVVAKATLSAATAAAMSVVALAAMLGVASVVAGQKDAAIGLAASDVSAAAGLVLASAAWAILGTCVGAIVRIQVGAIVGAVVWVFLVENLAAGFLGGGGQLLPGQAAHAVAEATAATDLLSAPAGAGVLLVYVVVLGTLAVVRTSRRELAFDG